MALMRRLSILAGAAALGAAAVWALWPQPIAVDLATVARGPMQGIITAEGVARVREPYAITAPISGAATRSPVQVGDPVVAGETVVATIRPSVPELMDFRSRAQAEATVAEAVAAVGLAETNLRQAQTVLDHAKQEYDRGRALADRGLIATQMLEDLRSVFETAEDARRAAEAQLDLNNAALTRAKAQLLGPQAAEAGAEECCLQIVAPQTGIVLSVADQSARPVQAGSPLLTIGNLDDLEIELDLLSSDAVRVPLGARAVIDRWGGETDLQAKVRRIDPAAFTRVSALGIEEQRVYLRLDLLTPPDERPGLGEGFRVHVRLIVWEEEGLLQVPQAALFRQGDGWAVFAVENDIATLRPVQIGRQSEGRAEVLQGLAEEETVILYPASSLQQGDRIIPRGQE